VAASPASELAPVAGRALLTLLAALAGGALAKWLHIPLPWVLGAMAGVACVSLAGAVQKQPPWGRRVAQLFIGCAIGLYFTPVVLAQVLGLAGWVLAGAVSALLLSVLAARAMQRLARVDGPTAIYSVALGASAEMTLQAQRAGADGALVASSHAVRIILVTCTASLVAGLAGQPIGAWLPSALVLDAWVWLPLSLAAAASALFLQRFKLPNPWLLGPVLVCGIAAHEGLQGRLPDAVLVAAQVVIGWGLGQNITRSFFRRAPRMLASTAVVTLAILAVCMALALGLMRVTGLPPLTAFLSLSPGGMAEMGVIAKAFGLGVPVVTAFHMTRVVCTIFLTRPLAQLMLRSGWVRP